MCTAKMAHQSRFEKDLERDVQDLISYVTGFKRQESNFSLCHQFVISKLRYHEYLDVDHCKVERAIQGIQEKLLLHSQLAKADAWSRLTESFLTPITPSSVLIKDDTRHGLMWLLIRLAESPSNAPFITKATECQESDQEDTWDSSFLGESRESDDAVLSDTTEWSEESWEEEVELRVQHNIQNKPVNAHGDHPVGSVTSTLTTKAKPVPFTSESEQDERNVLKQHLMLQFWRGNFRRRVWSKHPNSNLLDRWENYCCSSKPFYEPAHRVVMTEAQLVREILWLLSGARNLFAFKEEGGHVIVSKDIAVSHLTQVCLYTSLCSVAEGGEAVRDLQTFVDETVGWAKENVSSTQAGTFPCRTLQAFACGLGIFLQELSGVICTLEQSISQADKMLTLLMLLEQLNPWLERLGVLRQLLTDGVRVLSPTAPAALRTTCLLNSLHATLLHYDWSGHCGKHMVPLLLQLCLVTIQPYLDILEGWVGAGSLDDPLEEFVVQRNKGVSVHDNDFWNCTYNTRESLQQNTLIASSKLPGNVNSSEDPNEFQSIRTPEILSTAGVTFLEPILQQVKHAGKSMELLLALSALDTTDELLDTCKKSCEPSLALQFIQTFLAKFDHRVQGLQQCFPAIDLPSALISPTATESIPSYHHVDSSCSSGFGGNSKEDMKNVTTALFSQLPVGVCPDQLFAHSFSRLFFSELKAMDPQNNKSLPEVPVKRDCFEEDGKSLAGRLCCQPFQLILQECLYPHIQRRCEFVFSSLIQKLKQQHRLLECLEELRSSFLLQANGGMAEFATWLFEQAAYALPSLHHITELNVQLQRSLLAFQPKLATRLSVVLQNVDANKKHLLIHVLDGVGLHYKVCWPVNLVVTDETQQLLNQVFLLLLQMKYVKHRLDTLRFDELFQGQREPLGACMHLARRMFLLRMRLLHFVSSLNTYIITRILHSTVLEFVPRLEGAQNLQQLIDIHEQYVRSTHERCLLHEQASIMREAIMKVLDLALQFAMRWQTGLSTVRVEVITRVEKDVRNFLSFLLTLLIKATSRGSFPHLESLMLALLAGAETDGVRQRGV